MSHWMGIFTEKHVQVLTQYRPSGTFRLGMPHINKMPGEAKLFCAVLSAVNSRVFRPDVSATSVGALAK